MSNTYGIILFLTIITAKVYSAKILAVFPVPSISHQAVFQPIWKELSERGHEVTVLTPNPLNNPSLRNLTEIDLSFTYKTMEQFKKLFSQGTNSWVVLKNAIDIFLKMSTQVFENEEVQKFIKNDNTCYDVVLVEVVDPKSYAFAAKCKCPLIGIASLNAVSPTHETLGNLIHPVLYPDHLIPYNSDTMGLFEKTEAVLFYFYRKFLYDYYYIPTLNSIVKKHVDSKIPDLRNIEKNISMLFINTNPVIYGVRPYGPNVVEFVSGIHIKAPKPLASELKYFLDDATQGVVLFSLGTNVKSMYLSEDKRHIFLKTFTKLPYKVIWKFEDDLLEEKPENVKLMKWLPQQDVLRHPNIKLFITQAGLQSTEEALLNGVPLLALPFAGDQHFNANRIQTLRVGLRLDFSNLTEESLLSSILEIIENPKYKVRAKHIETLLKDQPMTGLEKVIWWTEYVIRNQGAAHLRNPRADVSWAEILMLDVVAFLFSILIIILFVVYRMCQYMFRLFFTHQKTKQKLQ